MSPDLEMMGGMRSLFRSNSVLLSINCRGKLIIEFRIGR